MATSPSFSRRRRFGIGFNVIVSTLALLAVIVMVNYFAAGHFTRRSFAASPTDRLSPQTIRVLKTVTNDIQTTVFFDPESEEELYGWIKSLLREYHSINPHIKIKLLDYTRYPSEAASAFQKFRADSHTDKNFVVMESAGRTRVFFANELAELDLRPLLSGESKEVHRTAFKGELLFTSAIFNLANARAGKIYFLTGHGEHSPDDATQRHGYGKFAGILKDEINVPWEKLSLQETNEIPSECLALVIAGPARAQLAPNEVEAISSYLKAGGRLFALLNNTRDSKVSGMDALLANFGIASANTPIQEDRDFLLTSDGDLSIRNFSPEHAVTKPLLAENLFLRLNWPRPLGRATTAPSQAGEAPKIIPLARTSDKAVSGQINQAFPVALAIEQGLIRGLSSERGGTRAVIVSDSLCLDNQIIDSAANHYFAQLAMSWLLDRPQILLQDIGPRPVRGYKLLMTTPQLNAVRWSLLAGLPGAILLLGGLVWFKRRK